MQRNRWCGDGLLTCYQFSGSPWSNILQRNPRCRQWTLRGKWSLQLESVLPDSLDNHWRCHQRSPENYWLNCPRVRQSSQHRHRWRRWCRFRHYGSTWRGRDSSILQQIQKVYESRHCLVCPIPRVQGRYIQTSQGNFAGDTVPINWLLLETQHPATPSQRRSQIKDCRAAQSQTEGWPIEATWLPSVDA